MARAPSRGCANSLERREASFDEIGEFARVRAERYDRCVSAERELYAGDMRAAHLVETVTTELPAQRRRLRADRRRHSTLVLIACGHGGRQIRAAGLEKPNRFLVHQSAVLD